MNQKQSLKDSIQPADTAHAHSSTHVVDDFEYNDQKALHRRLHQHVKKHVHTLRQRPDHHKRAIAFGTAFFVTFIVFIFWYLFSLPRIIGMYTTNKAESAALNLSPNIIKKFNDKYSTTENSASVSDVTNIQIEN